VAIPKLKGEAPISTNVDRPTTAQLALEFMETESRDIHILDPFRSIQSGKPHTKPRNVLSLDAFLASGLEESAQSFVPDGFDHHESVARCASRNKS
jgi:hypothetical protein